MSRRDPLIELYCILLMFGICLFHAVNSCGHQNLWLSSNLGACVNAFALLSGYFGIRFGWKKIIRLYLTGFYAAFVSTALLFLVDAKPWTLTYLKDSWMQFEAYWFLHAYIFLMLLSPLIESAFAKLKEQNDTRAAVNVTLPFLLLVFGWAFLKGVRPISQYVPTTAGLCDFSGVTLAGAYVVGRLMKIFNVFSRITTRMWLLIFLLLCVVIPYHFPGYVSPFVMILAVASFCLFKSLPSIRNVRSVCQMIDFVAPSCFAIYLLHCNVLGLRLMKELEDFALNQWHSALFAYLMTGGAAFCFGFFLDVPRRIMIKLLESHHGYND